MRITLELLKQLPIDYNLYLIGDIDPETKKILYKLGYSSKLSKRLNSYRITNPFIQLYGIIKTENAKDVEKYIHKVIKSDYLNEWYYKEKLNDIFNIIKLNNYDCLLSDSTLSDFVDNYEIIKDPIQNKIDILQASISIYEIAKKNNLKNGFYANGDFLKYTIYNKESDTYSLNMDKINKCID